MIIMVRSVLGLFMVTMAVLFQKGVFSYQQIKFVACVPHAHHRHRLSYSVTMTVVMMNMMKMTNKYFPD